MQDKKKIITAKEICESVSLARANPIAGRSILKRRKGEIAGSDTFVPTDVPDKIKLPPDRNADQISQTPGVWDFKFDPYLGDCSWSEEIDNVECRCLITLTEVDNWMFGFTQQTYTPPPGIRLIITKGVKRKPENHAHKINFGHRFNQSDVRVYIHRRSFRVELSKQYQEFATLSDGARHEGLAGVGFPVDWDLVPYDI
jgi:hypothetical protein